MGRVIQGIANENRMNDGLLAASGRIVGKLFGGQTWYESKTVGSSSNQKGRLSHSGTYAI